MIRIGHNMFQGSSTVHISQYLDENTSHLTLNFDKTFHYFNLFFVHHCFFRFLLKITNVSVLSAIADNFQARQWTAAE